MRSALLLPLLPLMDLVECFLSGLSEESGFQTIIELTEGVQSAYEVPPPSPAFFDAPVATGPG